MPCAGHAIYETGSSSSDTNRTLHSWHCAPAPVRVTKPRPSPSRCSAGKVFIAILGFPGDAEPMPLVSVIMNIRNGAAYLREAIDSVLAQTFSDWELIAWEHCSTDASAAIVAEYKDPRIRYFLA